MPVSFFSAKIFIDSRWYFEKPIIIKGVYSDDSVSLICLATLIPWVPGISRSIRIKLTLYVLYLFMASVALDAR